MFIELETGNIIIDGISFYKGYSFTEFKKTKFFKEQDGIRFIDLPKTKISNINFFVRLFWEKEILSVIDLSVEDKSIKCIEDEIKRKVIHDRILKNYGIKDGERYKWGTVESYFDPIGCISSILIKYDNTHQ